MEQLIDIERVEQLAYLFGNFDENIKLIESIGGIDLLDEKDVAFLTDY